MIAVLGGRPALARTANILVIGANHAEVREARDLIVADTRFQTHGARSTGQALALIAGGAFDAVLIDEKTWADRDNGIREALTRKPSIGVVMLGGGPRIADYGVVVVAADTARDTGVLGTALTAAIETAREHRRRATMVRWLERESTIDPLSGLRNARSFNRELREACDRDRPVGLVLLNVVGTGMVSHNYGHEASDRMLRHAAIGIGRSIRANDVAGRLTDDTFAVLVDEADLDLCRRIGRRIVQELSRSNETVWRGDIPVTVSVGMACGLECDADELMLVARKQLNRNRPFMPPPPALRSIGDDPSVA